MPDACPRCQTENRGVARFCGSCGLTLEPGVGGSHEAGRVRHPRPAELPPGFIPCGDAAQLYFRWESSLGGDALIGTEGLKVTLFNAGYALEQAVFSVRGEGRDGAVVLEQEYTLESLPRGREVAIEVPSYELSEPMRVLKVALVSAQFDAEGASDDA